MQTSLESRLALVALLPLGLVAALAPAASAHGGHGHGHDDDYDDAAPVAEASADDDGVAFDRDFAIGAYYSSWHGSYTSDGLGFKIRIEPLDALGIELYAEVLSVDVPRGSRMDIPAGFSLYIPISLFDVLRVRPLAGLCTMFSFANDDTIASGSADDILVGLHVGAGLELAVLDQWSIFVDATYQTYFGHARDVEAWSASIGKDFDGFEHFQVGAGLQFHL